MIDKRPRKGQSAWDAHKEAQATRVVEREAQRIARIKKRTADEAELRRIVTSQVKRNVSPYQKLVDMFRRKREPRDEE